MGLYAGRPRRLRRYTVLILDRQVKRLRNKEIPTVKVIWSRHSEEDATWESEADMRAKYPHLFTE